MKFLFIGGTGLISSACSDLALARGHELYILNRSISAKYPLPKGSTLLKGNVHTGEAHLASLMAGRYFDAVVDWIAFTPQDIERDIRLFRKMTDQFVFISSASAYQKPMKNYLITEETPLENPFWEYSRNKIDCENLLMDEYRKNGFPVTIVRPSHTYGPSQIPVAEGAALAIDIVPARGWCPDCAKAVAVSERLAGCPDCGNWRVEVTGGDDLRLKELEVE